MGIINMTQHHNIHESGVTEKKKTGRLRKILKIFNRFQHVYYNFIKPNVIFFVAASHRSMHASNRILKSLSRTFTRHNSSRQYLCEAFYAIKKGTFLADSFNKDPLCGPKHLFTMAAKLDNRFKRNMNNSRLSIF